MGKVLKAFSLDARGEVIAEVQSQQIVDGFKREAYGANKLQEPPYPLERLTELAESLPVHGACLEQKAVDVVGGGWEWRGDATDEQREELDDKLLALAGPDTEMIDLLQQVADDFETTGQGYLEVARDDERVVRQLFHVPSHTVRMHSDGQRYVQRRGGQTAWFKRWGVEEEYRRDDGAEREGLPLREQAHELLVLRKTSRRSSWYGVPRYTTAIGWVMLALAARDYNLLHFQNRREPRWLIVLENVDEDTDIEEAIRQVFAAQLKSPHRSVIIPLAGGAKIHLHKMSGDQEEGHFERLIERCNTEILVAHRVPPERVGQARVGALGGNVAQTANRTYKEAVIQPTQRKFEHLLNRFLEKELQVTGFELKLAELDLTEEEADLDAAVKGLKSNVMTVDEARERAGLPPLDPAEYGELGKQFLFQFAPGQAAAAAKDSDTDDVLSRLDDAVSSFLSPNGEVTKTRVKSWDEWV